MKKLIKMTLIPLAIAVIGSGAILIGNMSQEEPTQIEQSAITFDGEVVQSGEPIVEVSDVDVTTEAIYNEIPLSPTEQPVTLLSYAKTQLDLSTQDLENCFNMIVAEYPERFNGTETHKNVRALKGYANVCTSGIKAKGTGNIYTWDRLHKGAYFDSAIANANV